MGTEYSEGKIVYETYGIDFVRLFEFFRDVIKGFFGYGDPLADTTTYADVLAFLNTLWNIYAIIALLLSALFLYGIMYAVRQLGAYGAAAEAAIKEEEARWRERYSGEAKKNTRLDDVKEHIASGNPNDWRIAIVEADIVLEELLDKAGYPGTTIGEKLKAANPATFRTLQDAWEAHKVRNAIAHEGANFNLTQKIANETIIRYERVFAEFDVA